MTDKEQIMIHGIDVSKCNAYCTDGTCALAFTDLICTPKEKIENNCIDNPDCYYKQLARKTQECEELKSEGKELFNAKLELLRELDHYKRAYYGCQKPAKEKFVAPIPLPPAEFVDGRYLEALAEIKTVTEINCEEICGRKFEDCNDASCFSAELLDIINKAKGEGKCQ